MPPTTITTNAAPSRSRPRKTSAAPAARGSPRRWSMRTSGDVTAATTPATTTGTTIVLVSAATHVAPMRTAPTPASSHDANPRSLSHCGAEKTPVSSTDSSSTTSGSSPGSEPGCARAVDASREPWGHQIRAEPRGASSRAVRRSENGATGAIAMRSSIGQSTSPLPRPKRVMANAAPPPPAHAPPSSDPDEAIARARSENRGMSSRDVLPIPDRQHVGLTTYDAKDPDTSYPPIEPLLPPAGAPNVLVVLLDDAGFGSSSAFGGPCQTPAFERLAANGLRYNRFHTTALCSPTRQALLTGRNHHAVGMGGITEIATSAPGYNSLRPNTAAPLAETLKLNGYSTAQFGKCHEVPVWQTSPMGPFENWPSGGGGFEHFYGFIGGETNQYAPAIYDGTVPVEPDRTPEEGYHFTEDMTDHAIDWVRQQKALMPDKPFFVYYAPGATARAPPRSGGVVGQVQGAVRRRLGRAARGDARAPEGARGGPRGRRAHRAPRRDPGVGRHARRPEARPRPPDGGLRRLHGAHRPPRRPADRRPGRARDPRRHARLRDGGRQRRLRRGHAQRLLQRARRPQRRRRRRDDRVHGLAHRRLRHARGLQPLRGRLGPRDGHALPVDQADRLALGRHPQRDDRPLAGRHQGQGRGPHAVPPRHRHRRHGARRGRAPGAHVRPRRAADAAARRVHGLLVRRRGGRRAARDPVLRDVLQPRHLPQGLDRGHPPQHAVGDGPEPAARRRRVGALRPRRLDAVPRPRGRAAREAGRAAAAVPDRGDEVQRPAPRRPSRRALQPRPGRAPAARSAAPASCCSAAWAGSRRTPSSCSRTSRTP